MSSLLNPGSLVSPCFLARCLLQFSSHLVDFSACASSSSPPTQVPISRQPSGHRCLYMLSPLKYLPSLCRFKSKSETIVPFWTSPFRPTTLLRASGALETAPLAPKCSEFIPEMAFPLPMPVSPLALLLLPTPLFQAAPSSTMHRWTSSPLSIFLLFPSLRLGVPPVCLQAEDRALDPVSARSCVLTLLPAYGSPV